MRIEVGIVSSLRKTKGERKAESEGKHFNKRITYRKNFLESRYLRKKFEKEKKKDEKKDPVSCCGDEKPFHNESKEGGERMKKNQMMVQDLKKLFQRRT